MIEVITSIALLCQVTGVNAGFNRYEETKKLQKECQKKLLNCVVSDSKLHSTLETVLKFCVLQTNY